MKTPEHAMEQRLLQLRQLTGADFAALAVSDEDGSTYRWRNASGSRNNRYRRIVLRHGKGIVGTVIRSGRPLVMEDFNLQHVINPTDYPIVLAEKLVSIVGYPIAFEDRVAGVLLVGNRSRRPFSPTEIEIIAKFADLFVKFREFPEFFLEKRLL